MKLVKRWALITLLVLASIYLALPSPSFPPPPSGSYISQEPADTESIYRQAFYTNLSRSEIMNYYKSHFRTPFQFDLNHPPEDATTLIRDQTRSSYLEELIHPWKEVLYVNGYVPTKPEDVIVRNGIVFSAKVTVHYVPSTLVARLTVLSMTALASYFLLKEYLYA